MSEQLDCLAPILDKHASRYDYFIRMVDLRLRELILSGDASTVSGDDCHAVLDHLGCPPEADRRFIAAVWKKPGWELAGYMRSNRCQNHHRRIATWRLKG